MLNGQDWSALTPYRAFNLDFDSAPLRSGAGSALPATSAPHGDHSQVPWHPDSPIFWAVGLAVATVLGITGASVKVKAGPLRAGGSAGTA